eukprot:sb/3472005/
MPNLPRLEPFSTTPVCPSNRRYTGSNDEYNQNTMVFTATVASDRTKSKNFPNSKSKTLPSSRPNQTEDTPKGFRYPVPDHSQDSLKDKMLPCSRSNLIQESLKDKTLPSSSPTFCRGTRHSLHKLPLQHRWEDEIGSRYPRSRIGTHYGLELYIYSLCCLPTGTSGYSQTSTGD